MKVFLSSLFLVYTLFAQQFVFDNNGDVKLTHKQYLDLIVNKDSSVTTPINEKTYIYFTLTENNIGLVIQIILLIIAAISAVMFYRYKIVNLENNYKTLSESCEDHEKRIKINEEKQAHYATKEAVEKELKAHESGVDALSAISKVLNGEDNG